MVQPFPIASNSVFVDRPGHTHYVSAFTSKLLPLGCALVAFFYGEGGGRLAVPR